MVGTEVSEVDMAHPAASSLISEEGQLFEAVQGYITHCDHLTSRLLSGRQGFVRTARTLFATPYCLAFGPFFRLLKLGPAL